MTETDLAKPIPLGDELSAQYWAGGRHGELRIQRCQACGYYHHPATSRCFVCGSDNLEFEKLSGRGTIYSFTITYDARSPVFMAMQPYAVVWVELDEQPRLRLVTNMPTTPLTDLRIGAPVEVFFETLTDEVSLPLFRLAADSESS